MMETTPRLIEVDWAAFNPWKVTPVRHRISEHPLLQIEPLIELSTRLAQFGRIRTHSNEAYAGTAFNHAPMLYPNARPPAETLANIASAKAWMSLLNVQTDDIYRGLVDEVLDDLKPGIDRFDPGMVYRGGWIFVTSPNTVTPFHMDKEHNFILQIKGSKRLLVWDPDGIEVLSEAARDLFHANHSRDLVTWREEARSRAHVQPRVRHGAYMPSTGPAPGGERKRQHLGHGQFPPTTPIPGAAMHACTRCTSACGAGAGRRRPSANGRCSIRSPTRWWSAPAT